MESGAKGALCGKSDGRTAVRKAVTQEKSCDRDRKLIK